MLDPWPANPLADSNRFFRTNGKEKKKNMRNTLIRTEHMAKARKESYTIAIAPPPPPPNLSSYDSHLSYSMTMSAVARLIPNPPARVLSRKQNLVDPGSLNTSICESRLSPSVFPSILQYSCPTSRR